MNGKSKTYPVLGGDSGANFQERLASFGPHVSLCRACGRRFYYPRIVCPHCLSEDIGLVSHSGVFSVLSYTYVHRVQAPVFADEAPALMVAIEDGELRLIVQGVGWPETKPPVVGSAVVLDRRTRDDGSMIQVARPAEALAND